MKRRLWEQADFQCSIIGTCLSLSELKRIIRRLAMPLDQNLSEFVIHATFVNLCKHAGREAKAVEKLLNAKYGGVVKRFAKARDDFAIRALWHEARENGDIPGPYWAVLSNPHTSEGLRNEIFGEVHMLSHLVGASNRADIQRLGRLQHDHDALSLKHAAMRTQLSARIRDLERDNHEKKQQIMVMAKELERLRQNAKVLAAPVLTEENSALQHSLTLQAGVVEELEGAVRTLRQRLGEAEQRLERASMELDGKSAEIACLEKELVRRMSAPECPGCAEACAEAGTTQCPGPLLCGKRILYVGGRTNLVRHYRELVERLGGEFVHHDGGVEESRRLLPRLVNAVDAVICPLDCVSHDACLRVKALCGHDLKPLKLLPSSGLSSLVRCLAELGASHTNAEAM